jgi:hypothetical protein
MSQAILLIVQLLTLLLRTVAAHEDCPDGACRAPLDAAEELSVQLKSPAVTVGIFDLFRFLRCFPMDRVLAVGKRIVALFGNCDKCPDGECSFSDILKCLDLQEVISIVKEVIDIIRDSQICDGNSRNEITLGEAVS